MKKEQTLLAKVITQYYPENGQYAILRLDPRGKDTKQLIVYRGQTTDSNLKLIKSEFCFVKLRLVEQTYMIDKIVPVDNFLLTMELISDGH